MANWYYYNENGEKIEVTGKKLKELASQGTITSETIIETEEGKSALARKVKGLTFLETAQSTGTDNGMENIKKYLEIQDVEQLRENFERLQMRQEQQRATQSIPFPPPPPPPQIVVLPTPTANQTENQTTPQKAPFASPNLLKRGIILFLLLLLLIGVPAFVTGFMLGGRYRIPSPDIVAKPEAAQAILPVENIVADEPEQPEANEPVAPPFQSEFKDIFEAASKGTIQNVEYFLKNGADVNTNDNKYGDTPLHCAAAGNADVEVLKYLVSQGANVNANNSYKHTPLYCAAIRNSNVDVLEYLVSQDADVNAKDNEGKTPLDDANTEEKREVLRAAGGKSGTETIITPPPQATGTRPTLTLATGVDPKLYGKTLDDSDFQWESLRGKYVLIKFTATWCGPCQGEIPGMLKAYEKYHNKGLEIVSVYVWQHESDPVETVKKHVQEKQLPWIIISEELSKRVGHPTYRDFYGVRGVPTMVLVDKEGKIILPNARGSGLQNKLAEIFKVEEPVEITEARQQYEEVVEKAKTPYREELEKELALAKKKSDNNFVLSLEAELKHLNSKDGAELTAFAPDKRTLLTAKARYKNQIETAQDTYQKRMESLVKELTRANRPDDTKFVQEAYNRLRDRLKEQNHLKKPNFSLITPKRSRFAPVPVIHMTMELNADGKGRYGVSTGMSTDLPSPLFPSSPFPLSAFPKAQAFRGQNGMGRVIFDFRNADPLAAWEASGWIYSFNHSKIDTQRKTLRFESSQLARPSFSPGKFSDLPFRVTIEAVANPRGYCPLIYFWLNTRQGERSYIALWRRADASLMDRLLFSHYGRFNPDGSRSDIALPNAVLADNQPIWTFFELPKMAVGNVASVYYQIEAGHEQTIAPRLLDLDVEIILVDISGRLKAATGFTVGKVGETVMVRSVSPRTAAFRAGLMQGDEIIRFNGEKISVEQIQRILNEVKFGTPISVAVIRNGEEKVFRFYAE
jgi:thiol-disulfide isomerase/thioredoxin